MRTFALLALVAGVAHAQAQAQVPARPSIGFLHLEPLGLDAERALRLETLFRAELDKLSGAPLPSRAVVDTLLSHDAALRGCNGEAPCLAAIGKKLGVGTVVAGNVGALGDSFVVNLKLVDVERATELRRVSEKLSGSPDQLIDAVRVAAYRLVAPDELRGALAILCDVRGADVVLDGARRGRTPLRAPIAGLAVGPHQLRVEADGFSTAASEVDVHFQKTSEVVVRMIPATPLPGQTPAKEAPRSWYNSPWTWAAVAVVAVGAGVLVGRALGSDHSIDCTKSPTMCQP